MGTNFYAVSTIPTTSYDEWRIHIGKSSCGWLFCFHDCEHFHTFPQVVKWLSKYVCEENKYVLMNEYDQVVPVADFINLVQEKQNDSHCKNNPDNFLYSKNIDGYRFSEGEFC